jgi:hypothetical protein
LTWVEGDAAAIDLHRDVVWPECRTRPLDDDRLQIVNLDPALAVACKGGVHDLIVSNPTHPALWHSSPYFTAEFYRRVSRRLAGDGIFCQRFQHVDFGCAPLQTIAATMRRAFQQVIAVRVGPGEILFLGTNSQRGLVRDGLIDRLQAQHVRRQLARVGWDWSIVLNLPLYGKESFAALAAQAPPRLNSAGNGRLAFTLPRELLRWGNKLGEVETALAKHGSRLLEWKNVDGSDPDLLRRLSDVVGQHKLMTSYTDQPWAYRKTLREDLTKSSRSIIEQVSAQLPERSAHPVDKQRKEYLVALGKAAESRSPDKDRLARLEKAALPYDPLLTYFMHHEAAELYSRTEPRDVQAELAHRLYAAYFADARDRSIRNVASALDLLAEHPSVVPNAGRRWDHMNALIQTLKLRWDNRSSGPTSAARIELVDVEKSISALEHAFAAMQSIRGDAGFTDSQWQARRQVVEVTLVRPLRTYRSRLLPHALEQRKKTQEILEKTDAE